MLLCFIHLFFLVYRHHRDLHVLTNSCPTRRSSDLDGGMSGNTLTRAQLSEAVYQQVGLSRNESADLVESVLNEIVNSLAKGESVKISSFGSFHVRAKEIGREHV